MKRLLALPTALILAIAVSTIVLGSTYEHIKLYGSVITDQVNQVRSPDLTKKYFLYSVADQRAQAAVDHFAATGDPSWDHDLNPVVNKLNSLGVCYNWVGENIGRATLRTSPPAATADDAVDLWEASPTHNSLMKDPSGDWGGGAIVESHIDGYYYFIFYVVDVCGV